MEEQQVDAEPGVVQPETSLTTDEGEIVAQLQKEVGEMLDQRILEIRLRILVLQIKEFEDKRVLDGFLGE